VIVQFMLQFFQFSHLLVFLDHHEIFTCPESRR
jgi:hypothetical protein